MSNGPLAFYILINRVPVPVSDMDEWAKALDERWRLTRQHDVDPWRVAETWLDNCVSVSTVFLGINHNFFNHDPPLLFETMIFGGRHDQYQNRCCTWEEAEKMHEEAVALVKRGHLRVVK
jgi:hypothetical protein